jgi:hypothetical protein
MNCLLLLRANGRDRFWRLKHCAVQFHHFHLHNSDKTDYFICSSGIDRQLQRKTHQISVLQVASLRPLPRVGDGSS